MEKGGCFWKKVVNERYLFGGSFVFVVLNITLGFG